MSGGTLFDWTPLHTESESKIVLDWTLKLLYRIRGLPGGDGDYSMMCGGCRRKCIINRRGVRVLSEKQSEKHYVCVEPKSISL